MRTAILLPLLLPVALQVALAPAAPHDPWGGPTQLRHCPLDPRPTPCDGPPPATRLTDAPRASVQPGDWKLLDDSLAGAPPLVRDHGSSPLRIDTGVDAAGTSAPSGPTKPRAPPAAPLS